MLALFSILLLPLFAESVETKDFFYCSQNRASGSEVQTLKIQFFPKDKTYLFIQTKKGVDSVRCQGAWFFICESLLKQTVEHLSKNFWSCKRYLKADVFYSYPVNLKL